MAANAALRRLRPAPDQLMAFKKHPERRLCHLDPTKIECHGETHILDFLRDGTRPLSGDAPAGRCGNGKRDLTLHPGETAASLVSVVPGIYPKYGHQSGQVFGCRPSEDAFTPSDIRVPSVTLKKPAPTGYPASLSSASTTPGTWKEASRWAGSAL